MRSFIFSLLLLIMSSSSNAQSPYLAVPDPKHPDQMMLVGSFSMNALLNDTSFAWFSAGMKGYQAKAEDIAMIAAGKSDHHLLVFAGTWCEDSQFILPRLFQLFNSSDFPENHLTLYGVDRDKKSTGNIAAAFGITNVPTLIVMKNGKELGRVVEYGKTGNWEKEIAELFK